jgi:exopolysaccharide biosynthesis polyprenyl glycosylphosphotransferase
MPMSLWERRLLVLAGDVAALLAAGLFAVLVRAVQHRLAGVVADPDVTRWQVLWLCGLAVVWLGVLTVNGGYQTPLLVFRGTVFRRVLTTTGVVAAGFAVVFFVLGRPVFGPQPADPERIQPLLDPLAVPRVTPVLFLLVGTITVGIWRHLMGRLLGAERWRRRIVVVGQGEAAATLVREVENELVDTEVVGFVATAGSDDVAQELRGLKRLDLNRLPRCGSVDEVVVTTGDPLPKQLVADLVSSHAHGVRVRTLSAFYEEAFGRVPVALLGRRWFPAPLADPGGLPTVWEIFKRAIDLMVGSTGLVLLAVLIGPVALAIRLDGPGPIFFRQQRLGRSGRRFWLIKLRSMVPDAENGNPVWASHNDPRVTRVGRVLRKLRLDELPQVINVLRGEMSVVGPRPERPELVADLEREIPHYRARLSVKPGLTGWAQVNLGYGATIDDMRQKLEFDLYYVRHKSFWLDLLIILRTIGVIAAFRGR